MNMKKKSYIAPSIAEYVISTTSVLMGSQLDSTSDNQNITPTDEEYSGEFQSRRNVWDDEEEEDLY